MILTQYYLDCLSHGSYLIGDEASGHAVVVDPRRDIEQYLQDAAEHRLTIVGTINTHFHADFLAGHLELAAATGAWIGYGRAAEAEYEIRNFSHGEKILLGDVELEILETPGHTWESISILIREHANDQIPHAVLTGDALFIGDVGRPDLAASVGASPVALAHALYGTIHNVLMKLPDEVQVMPAHGAGSACGKNLSDELVSTIGSQRLSNPSVQPMPEADFVQMITSGQPAIPLYFATDAVLNRQVRSLLETGPLAAALTPAQVRARQAAGGRLLDVRTPEEFADGHLPGSINVGLEGRFSETAGMVLDVDENVIILAASGRQDEAALRLGRIGFDNVDGYAAGFGDLEDLLQRARRLSVAEFDEARADDSAVVVDVRNPSERDLGFIPGSVHIPLAEITSRACELPTDRPLLVHCAGGWRSSVAASALRIEGHQNVADLIGGYNAWLQAHATADV
jgi:hydroxyacylglutathione hydrolase